VAKRVADCGPRDSDIVMAARQFHTACVIFVHWPTQLTFWSDDHPPIIDANLVPEVTVSFAAITMPRHVTSNVPNSRGIFDHLALLAWNRRRCLFDK
jgi:hypothetical protein